MNEAKTRAAATIRKLRTVQTEGNREVTRRDKQRPEAGSSYHCGAYRTA
jgi:hypothetical protein